MTAPYADAYGPNRESSMALPDSVGLDVHRPDFLVIGAPKAGSTALHDTLARHPQLYPAPVKEPKYFLSPDRPPTRHTQRGPGDAHSAQEWIWRERDYRALFEQAPAGALRFESTPFYLWDKDAHVRIARRLPGAKLIAVVRDPVDRAFSNWTHLWADGLEFEPDFLTACRAEPARVAEGWAPFWRYLELGRYGEQLAHLFDHVPREQVLVLRYRQLVDEPVATLDRVCRFLGVAEGVLDSMGSSNVGRWAAPGRVNEVLRTTVRLGAAAGAYVPPQLWRTAQRPLLAALQRGAPPRPRLDRDVREQLVGDFTADVALLSDLLGADYSDWLAPEGRGTYTVRRSCEPSAAVAST